MRYRTIRLFHADASPTIYRSNRPERGRGGLRYDYARSGLCGRKRSGAEISIMVREGHSRNGDKFNLQTVPFFRIDEDDFDGPFG